MAIAHRILLIIAALCFVAATVCFGFCFVGVVRLMLDMPQIEADAGLQRTVSIQTWGLRFLGLSILGGVILWFAPWLNRHHDET